MNSRKAATYMTMAVSLTAALIFASLVAYAVRNDSGHTGFDPYIALAVFIPVTAMGLVQVFFQRGHPAAMIWGIVALIIGLAGIVLLIWLDRSGTLVYYEDWLTRSMDTLP